MLIRYEGVAFIFNDNINKSHLWAFSWISNYFLTWSKVELDKINLDYIA